MVPNKNIFLLFPINTVVQFAGAEDETLFGTVAGYGHADNGKIVVEVKPLAIMVNDSFFECSSLYIDPTDRDMELTTVVNGLRLWG